MKTLRYYLSFGMTQAEAMLCAVVQYQIAYNAKVDEKDLRYYSELRIKYKVK